MSAQPPQWPPYERPQPGQQPQGRQPSPQPAQQQRPPQSQPQGPPPRGPQQPSPPRSPGGRRSNGDPQRPAARPNGTGAGVGRGRVVLAAGLSVVLLIGMFSVVTWAAIAAEKQREKVAAQPSPTPYSVPKASDPTPPAQKNVLAKLPDLCPKLATALPADLRPGSPEHSKVNDAETQHCLWVSNTKKTVFWVSIDVNLHPDSDPATAIATADQELDEDKDFAADTKSNGGFHKNVHEVTGVGDRAFSDEMTNIVIWTEDGPDGKEQKLNYHVGGARLYARSGNANIDVAYLGATYPESQNVKELHGTNVTYTEGLAKTKQLVEIIQGQLK